MCFFACGVLILVVVDNGLVLRVILNKWWIPSSLNPCCSGQWSRTIANYSNNNYPYPGLNPCCSGQWSRTNPYEMKQEVARES